MLLGAEREGPGGPEGPEGAGGARGGPEGPGAPRSAGRGQPSAVERARGCGGRGGGRGRGSPSAAGRGPGGSSGGPRAVAVRRSPVPRPGVCREKTPPVRIPVAGTEQRLWPGGAPAAGGAGPAASRACPQPRAPTRTPPVPCLLPGSRPSPPLPPSLRNQGKMLEVALLRHCVCTGTRGLSKPGPRGAARQRQNTRPRGEVGRRETHLQQQGERERARNQTQGLH